MPDKRWKFITKSSLPKKGDEVASQIHPTTDTHILEGDYPITWFEAMGWSYFRRAS